jgi:8-oxo-dGTP pyrophosphatase MutT (NUDIX family)
LFEKSDNKYIFPIGGKIKINETSQEAIIREIEEEIGMKVKNLKLCSVLENLYSTQSEKVHEICFVYKTEEIFTGLVPNGFIEVSINEIENFDIKPAIIPSILKNKDDLFKHIILN